MIWYYSRALFIALENVSEPNELVPVSLLVYSEKNYVRAVPIQRLNFKQRPGGARLLSVGGPLISVSKQLFYLDFL